MNTTTKADIYDRITASIIEAIENRPGEFRMPWHQTGEGGMTPTNVASKKAYRGVNILNLWITAASRAYSRNTWGTYKQWQERGAQVRTGEKATLVVFWKFTGPGTGETQDGEETTGNTQGKKCFARGYHVFNVDQVDGAEAEPEAEGPPRPQIERITEAEAFFARLGANIQHGGGHAYYRPTTDQIQMPELADFFDAEAYYSTLAHELTHWTGHPDRCNREKLAKRFGDHHYAAEELIAELGAAFTLGTLGLSSEPRIDHAQYIASWLHVLKNDNRAIFTAASRAQAAADWMQNKATEASATQTFTAPIESAA